MSSLRRRLGRVLAVLVAGFAVQWLVSDRALVWVGESEMATRLQHDADSLAQALRSDAQGGLRLEHGRLDVVYERPYSGHYYVVREADRLQASPSFGDADPFEPPAVADETLSHETGPRGQPLLMVARPLELGTRRVTLAIGEDLTNLHRQLTGFRLLFALLSVLVFGATLLLQGREFRVALAPVEQARDAVLRLREGGERAGPLAGPDEIQPLLDEIQRLMRHVERRLQQSRTAIGNLSHALKTPLTGLFRLIDDDALAAHPDLRARLREQAETIRTRIERELKRARLAGDRPGGVRFVAADELPALVQLLGQIHRERGLAIEWHAPDHPLPFDREDLLELIGNLADNACKWAAGRVRIDLEARGGLAITVSDDGPGASDEMLASMGSRGVRADESRPGHGLGLAIVRDIVGHAGGTLEFGRSRTLGGLEVRVVLPLA